MQEPSELDVRAHAARSDLVTELDIVAPPFRAPRPDRNRRRVLAAGIVVLLIGAAVIAGQDDGGPAEQITAGPQIEAGKNQNRDLMGAGEARPLPASPLAGRSTMAAVWTGSEMLVWGGDGQGGPFDDGAAYDPRSDSWRMLPQSPLSPRNAPAAVWTGAEMILWGGHSAGTDHIDGAAYDPATDRWRDIADAPMTSAGLPRAVWTGERMLVIGGFNARTMASYDPATDQWQVLADLPGQPVAPENQVAWTGTELIAQLQYPGGTRSGIFSYHPGNDEWRELPPLAHSDRTTWLAWTGTELLAVPHGPDTTVTAYDPATNQWRGVARWPDKTPITVSSTAWTGDSLLLWGGDDVALVLDPTTGTWTTTPAGGTPRRVQAATVWADGVYIVWGGWQDGNDGVVLRPTSPTGSEEPGDVAVPSAEKAEPDYVSVAGVDGTTPGTIDQNGPPATWNGRVLPLHPVEDADGRLVGYFGCRYFERAEVERDDFDATAGCATVTTRTGTE